MDVKPKFRPNPELKLLDQVKQVLRYHHYSIRTEQAYVLWITRFVKFFHCKKHPKDMGKKEIEQFLSYLVIKQNIAAATQRQAFNAILFLYRDVLNIDMDESIEPVKSKRQKHPPVVLTKNEVKMIFNQMSGKHLLMTKLLYGSGLRLMECVRLRVQNLDFERDIIYIRAAKGGKDRTTLLPNYIKQDLQEQVAKAKILHENDLSLGYGEVYLPNALAQKYKNAAKEFHWQYVFPGMNLTNDPRTGIVRRHHVLESGLQKAVKTAVKRAGISKRISCHTFRHSFATHLLEDSTNIRIVQELMGHGDVKTTEIYTHVMAKDIRSVNSPLDNLNLRS